MATLLPHSFNVRYGRVVPTGTTPMIMVNTVGAQGTFLNISCHNSAVTTQAFFTEVYNHGPVSCDFGIYDASGTTVYRSFPNFTLSIVNSPFVAFEYVEFGVDMDTIAQYFTEMLSSNNAAGIHDYVFKFEAIPTTTQPPTQPPFSGGGNQTMSGGNSSMSFTSPMGGGGVIDWFRVIATVLLVLAIAYIIVASKHR